jgi:sortase A
MNGHEGSPTGSNGSNGHGSNAGEAWPSSGVGARPATVTRRESAPKRAVASVGFLLDASRRRRSGRIALWGVVVALALSGIGLLSYPVVTDIWANSIQGNLGEQLDNTNAQEASRAFSGRKIAVGAPFTRLRIPKLGVNVVVVEGVTGNALRAGAGHYPTSALPTDVSGNVAIAGHRTGFGEPFRHLERLSTGDRIELVTPFGRFVYEVVGPFDGHANPWITGPADWSVVTATPLPSLTLTTCDPPHTSKNRLIVRAVRVT